MRPLAVAITFLTVAAQPAATQDRYHVAWWDAASVLVAGGLSVIPEVAGQPRLAVRHRSRGAAHLLGVRRDREQRAARGRRRRLGASVARGSHAGPGAGSRGRVRQRAGVDAGGVRMAQGAGAPQPAGALHG